MIQAVFFDLDGTLADSGLDLAAAVNRLLIEEGQSELAYSELREYVSGGSPALLKVAFGIEPEGEGFENLKERFLALYEANLAERTCLFAGIQKSLKTLTNANIPWGIITNKPAYLAEPLVELLGLAEQSCVLIGGDTYAFKKPHPYPLLQASKLTQIDAKYCLYVGDDERDIIAAKAAGMKSVCAMWGYLSNQDPLSWNADYYVEKSEQLDEFFVSQLRNVDF